MRSRRAALEHQEAVSRRLALLSAELSASRGEGEDVAREGDGSAGPAAPAADGTSWWDGHTRVAAARPALAVVAPVSESADQAAAPPEHPPPQDPPSPEVPRPGRHASRRVGRLAAESWPDTLRGRIAVGPTQLTVVAVLVAAGLAITCWWVVRGDAAPSPSASASEAASPAGDLVPLAPAPTPEPGLASAGGAATNGAAGSVTVDVSGKVRHPGIAVLDGGARVVDALEAAGGARSGVDLVGLNLARVLVDGEQIVVGRAVPGGGTGAGAPSGVSPPAGGALVSLNAATEAELDTLPQVGPVTAQAILAWRDEHGGFSAVEELLEVDGIGEATLERIAPHVTL